MTAISINLLPIDTAVRQRRLKKFRLVQVVSTGILLLLIFLASVTAGLRILQTQNIKKIQAQAATLEQEITSQKDKESQIYILKSRLDVIEKYFGKLSPQAENYNFILSTLPPTVDVSSVTVDRNGGVLLAVSARDSNSLNELIEKLTVSRDQISKVSIESISRGQDASLRANLQITTKK